MTALVLLAGLAALAAVVLLLGLRWPVLLAYGVLLTMSLDYLGSLGFGPLTANNLLKATALLVVGLRLLQTGEPLRLPGHLLHFLPFILVAGLASAYSPVFEGAVGAWLRLVFVWVFALLLANLLTGEANQRWLLHAMAAVLLINAGLASVQALQLFTQGPLAVHGAEQAYRTGARVSGTFWNPNKMAVHLAGMIILLFAVLPSLRRRWQQLAYLTAILLGLVAILLSMSRSGYLAVGLAILLFLASRRHRRQAALVIVAGGLALAALLLFTPYRLDLLERLGSFARLGEDRSGQIRTNLIMSGLGIWADGPRFLWGAGYESFPAVMISHLHPLTNHDGFYHAGIRASHNLWITILAELGLIGVTAVLLFLRGIARELHALLARPESAFRRDLLVGLAVYLVVKLVDFNLNPEFEENFFWYALGLLGALALEATPTPAPAPAPTPPPTAAIDPPAAQC